MTPIYSLFFVLVLALTGMMGYATFSTARLLTEWQPEQNLLLMPGEMTGRLVLIGVCWLLGMMSGQSAVVLGWTSAQPMAQVVWGVASGLALAVILGLITHAVVRLSGHRYYSPIVIRHILPKNGWELAGAAAAFVPFVLFEELLFRSLWLGGFSAALPVWFLLVVSAVLFGLLHSPQGLLGVGGAAAAALVFGLLFLHAESLLMPFVAHYVANMGQLVVGMWLGEEYLNQNE